ncbi:MAG: MMPL domain-containing protein [bacterium]|nr:MAG: MMPL domain-containing protein [bacterium]KAF0147808.1 MAG: MMPL domain-containing protein [bacterium]KAF0167889.1 MAG: MMPL domain protein [bacterium]TXT18902.1 MAG: MMPL domain protein [bacterium]
MFPFLGGLTGRHPWLIVWLGAILVALGSLYSLDLMQRLTLAPGWEVPDSGSDVTVRVMRDQLGRDETPVILLFRPRSAELGDADSPAYRAAVEEVLGAVAHNADVRSVLSYHGSGDTRFRSRDGREVYAVAQLARGSDEGLAAFERLRAQVRSERVEVLLGGELATYYDIRAQLEIDILRAEVVSFLVLAVLLVWVFGSVVAAMLPLIVGGVTIILSVALLKWFTQFIDISVYAANVVSMLGLALAIDYALFIVSRFREELARDPDVRASLMTTLRTAGRTVAYSGMTVAASLFCLLMLPQRFFQNMGLAGGISVAGAMLTSILLLPALLALLGHRVNRLALPVLARRVARQSDGGRWYRFSYFVMRRAWLVLIATLGLLLVLGWPVLHMAIGPADSKSLPLSAESRQVQDSLEQRFQHADMSPLVVTVHAGGPVQEAAGLAGLHELTRRIRELPGVLAVKGLVSIDDKLELADYELLYAYPEQFAMASETLATYARGEHSVLYVEYAHPHTSPEARELVRAIRAMSPPQGIQDFHVGGFPAFHLDYLESLGKWVPWTILAIVVVIFVLLFFMLGSVLIPLKAVLTNLLSLSATFGALVWMFQDGNLSSWLNFTPQGSMDGTILVLIFAAAFGLSIDYEVFLLSRVKEMCQHSQDNQRAVATGIQRSGPIITSAALLIGVVLGAFAMGEVVFMKAMGLGLLLSVIVDATLVRMLLVPASLRLLGHLNWWAPRPLMRLYQRFNMSELDSESARGGRENER